MKAASMDSVALRSVACQADPASPDSTGQGTNLSPMLAMLRSAIDESGWKHAAIAAALAVEPQYLSRMLAGEKPWTIRHLLALPDDVETLFVKRYAESFGLIVIERVSDVVARRHLASGLFNMLLGPSSLPVKAGPPVKAELSSKAKKASGQ